MHEDQHKQTSPAEIAQASFTEMRTVVARADALISAAQCLWAQTTWGPEVDAVRVQRIGLLLDAACDAAEDAIIHADRFHSLFDGGGL